MLTRARVVREERAGEAMSAGRERGGLQWLGSPVATGIQPRLQVMSSLVRAMLLPCDGGCSKHVYCEMKMICAQKL